MFARVTTVHGSSSFKQIDLLVIEEPLVRRMFLKPKSCGMLEIFIVEFYNITRFFR